MKNRFFIPVLLAALTLFSCSVKTVSTGSSVPDKGWLMTGDAPYTLKTVLEQPAGDASFVLVKDLSLMADVADTVFQADVVIAEDGSLEVELGNIDPGFYEVRLRDSVKFNIGICPEKVVSKPDAKPDFKKFWDETFAELDTIFLEPEYTLIPEYSDSVKQCFEVRYNSFGGALSGGIISVPVKEGKYPVRVEYMGYGAEPFYYDPTNDPGSIQFLVSVRDQGIFKNGQDRWIDRGIDSKETFYYRGAFCDVKRAVDFVKTLPKADVDDIVVMGESQGGAFAVVSGATNPCIRAVSTAVPFLGDYRDYSKIVWWPVHEVLETADVLSLDYDELFDMLTYFDVKNFAPMVKCPVIMAFGLQDPTCPPHTNFSIYNNLGSREKQYVCVPTCGHAMWLEPEWPPLREQFFEEHK